MAQQAAPQAMTPQDLYAVNAQARAVLLANAVEMKQQIFSASVDPVNAGIVNVLPRNVGLIKGFYVVVSGTISNTGMTNDLTRTGFGAGNMVSNFTFQDLNNNVRINTPGWHIMQLNSARQGFGFGGAYAPNLPSGIGNNRTVQSVPTPVAAGDDQAVTAIWWVPLAYAADDLRGAIYAAVVNATMNLQITINPSPVAASGDPAGKVYTGNTGGWKSGTTVTVTVFQVFLDQIPMQNGVPILPPVDLNTIYELKSTTLTGMATGQDFPYAYANYRDFLSTMTYYSENTSYSTDSDINYFSLTSANFTNLFKLPPQLVDLEQRQIWMADPPNGIYYFDHRRRPINTQQFGNMELNLNAAAATGGSSGCYWTVCVEDFAQINQLIGGASLSAGG